MRKTTLQVALGISILLLASCRLIISVDEGGSVQSDTGALSCNEPRCVFDAPAEGLVDNLTATPDSGYYFAGWEGLPCPKQLSASCVIAFIAELASLDNDVELRAKFAKALFEDDFSTEATNWYESDDSSLSLGYLTHGYHINLKATPSNRALFGFATLWGGHLTGLDVVIEVDAKRLSGGDENYFGILCRSSDDDNFYVLAISSAGSAFIGKRQAGGAIVPIVSVAQAPGVRQGGENNRIRAECSSSRLALYANGEFVAETNDSDIVGGTVGMIAGVIGSKPSDIFFDNIVVWLP